MENEIKLVFNKSNDFDPIAKKYGVNGSRESLIKNVRWLLNNAMSSIMKAYDEGAPRRIEMEQLHNDLMNQLRNQLNEEEIETNLKE